LLGRVDQPGQVLDDPLLQLLGLVSCKVGSH
jgi:hypothetical protein